MKKFKIICIIIWVITFLQIAGIFFPNTLLQAVYSIFTKEHWSSIAYHILFFFNLWASIAGLVILGSVHVKGIERVFYLIGTGFLLFDYATLILDISPYHIYFNWSVNPLYFSIQVLLALICLLISAVLKVRRVIQDRE